MAAKPYRYPTASGPFRADQVREGDPYELSDGHAILCAPTGGRGSGAAVTGAFALSSDPAVESSGVETGYSPADNVLRAPDVSIGNVPDEPGWVKGVPPLAVEYADTGQDEANLARKIAEQLGAGSQLVWVVRLNGPHRVEIHAPGQRMRTARPGEEIEAPGILKNPVPVEALYDRRIGLEVTLRNLLQRRGYDSLDAVRAEGEARGEARGRAEGEARALRDAIRDVLDQRGLAMGDDFRAALDRCQDPTRLRMWLRKGLTAAEAREIQES